MRDSAAIIGDIHGEAAQFENLILKIKEREPEIELFSLGDMIDRGPDSRGVIELCIKHNIKGILGNHELYLVDLIKNRVLDSIALTPIMGGYQTFSSYGVQNFNSLEAVAREMLDKMPNSHKDYFKSLPLFRELEIEGEKYWLIHAGLSIPSVQRIDDYLHMTDQEIMNAITKSGQPENYIMWPSPNVGTGISKRDNLFQFTNATQIFGHRPVGEPIINDKFIAIDTGCGTCNPFKLSAILLPSKQVIQA